MILAIIAGAVLILMIQQKTQFLLSRMILAIIAGAVLILLIVAGWCAWRFLKKKRPKGADEKVIGRKVFLFMV